MAVKLGERIGVLTTYVTLLGYSGLTQLVFQYAGRQILPCIKTTLTAIAAVNCSQNSEADIHVGIRHIYK